VDKPHRQGCKAVNTQASLYVHIGHFGSGKTELSLNLALRMAAHGSKVALVDLDIVNPFFRSGEQRELLESHGVKLIAPLFVNTTVDIPALPAEVNAVFTGLYSPVILDVGGDPAGATALGRYQRELSQTQPWVRCVVNTLRPFTATPEEIVQMVRDMESRGRIHVNSLVNNTNLSRETTAEQIATGADITRRAAELLGIPMEFTCARRDLCPALEAFGFPNVEPLDIYTHNDWIDTPM
jgi:hypothetical protein